MLYLITPTGDRLKQFEICVELMMSQTYSGDVTWIIIDDGKANVSTPYIKNWQMIHKILPYEEGNTQHRNVLAALKECDPKGKILVIEDDDFYPCTWLSKVSYFLDYYQLVGMKNNIAYNIQYPSFCIRNNRKHSSLCSTALHSIDRYNCLCNICLQKPFYIDLALWRSCPKRMILPNKKRKSIIRSVFSTSIGDSVIGIKGLSGRSGLTPEHKQRLKYPDPNFKILKTYIGDYFTQRYLSIIKS